MIIKAEVKLTVLLAAKSVEEAAATLGMRELGDIVFEITEGEWLGSTELMSTTRILPWNVRRECAALDGPDDFFGDS